MKFGKNGGRTTVAGTGDEHGSAELLRCREKRGREKRERRREKEVDDGLSLP
jgi:hypothetical protein